MQTPAHAGPVVERDGKCAQGADVTVNPGFRPPPGETDVQRFVLEARLQVA